MLPPAPYQGHSYSSLWILKGFKAPVLRLVGRVDRLKFPEGTQHSTLVRQHKRTGSNHVSIYYILVHMKLGTAAMFVLSDLPSTNPFSSIIGRYQNVSACKRMKFEPSFAAIGLVLRFWCSRN
ncbi:unnamed protein product [Sphagnum balticum]